MNTEKRNTQLVPSDMIRVETALSRFPVHRLAKSGTVRIELSETNDKGEMILRWEIGHHSKYGQPGPLAYKVDTLVVNRRLEEAGRPIPRIVRLGSLNDICRELGQAESGRSKGDIKRALYQNSSAYITAKVCYRATDGTERGIEIGDTRYAVVFTGEKLPDGRTADAVYIILHDFYREILDHALTRPLDYEYLRELPPTAQRLYELASYQVFAAIKHGRGRARLSYTEFSTYAPQTRYMDFDRVKKQMYKVHAPHRKAGYIADVEFEATTDREGRPDWTMIYTPGPKAKAEFVAFTGKGGPVVLEAGPTQPGPGPEPNGLERELVNRGVTRGVAAALVRDFPEASIRAQVEQVDWLRERQPKRIKDVGAYLAESIRGDYAPPAGFEGRAERAAREATARAQQEQAREAKGRVKQIQARVAGYWAGLTPEEQGRLDAAAVAEAAPAARAAYETAAAPVKRLHLTALREAHIRRRLGLAATD